MHIQNIGFTDVKVLNPPRMKLNFKRTTYEESYSEEMRSEPMHSYRAEKEYRF